MGEKEIVTPVVLDTNVLVSALLFSGDMERIVEGWKAGMFVPVFSRETFDEFRRVLTYPKFSLTASEIRALIENEVLPFCEVVEVQEEIQGVCRDTADEKFLSCAVAAGVDYIVSGDNDLLALGSFREISIVNPAEFLEKIHYSGER